MRRPSIRVFVSSTFADMQSERDELARRVFPRLRRRCEERGVVWSDVDLRWGITDEEAAEGRVLSICLEEIDRCRPFFIGLLGDRYGWVVDDIAADVLEREPWLADARGASLTELEFRHAALRQPPGTMHAFFYLRQARDAPASRAAGLERLAALRDAVKRSGFPVREYPSAERLGDLVAADLEALVDQLCPEPGTDDPDRREDEAHAYFAEHHARGHVSRARVVAALDRHIDGTGSVLAVVGDSGAGKSALVAGWIDSWRTGEAAGGTPRSIFDRLPRWLGGRPNGSRDRPAMFAHFVGATRESTDWAAMLRRLMRGFQRRFDLDHPIPTDPAQIRAAFAGWLEAVAARGRIAIAIDGVDQLEDRDEALALAWLPIDIPRTVRVLLTMTPGPSLDEVRRRGWPAFELAPLAGRERESFAVAQLALYRRRLDRARLRRIVASPACASPLFLRTLIEELRLVGRHEELDAAVGELLAAGTAAELFQIVLGRLERDCDRDRPALVADSLALLATAREGLTEREVLDLLGVNGTALPSATWSPLFLALRERLIDRGGVLALSHRELRAAIERRYLDSPSARQRAHARLAEYFAERPLGPRALLELPWHLLGSGAWRALARLMQTPGFLAPGWSTRRFEIKAYWAAVEEHSPLRMVDAYRDPGVLARFGNAELSLVAVLLAEAGHLEAAIRLAQHLERAPGADLHAAQVALSLEGRFLRDLGRLGEAAETLAREEAVCRRLGDDLALAACLGNRAVVLREQGDLSAALDLLRQSEALCRALGDEAGTAVSLGNQAVVLLALGDTAAALPLLKTQEEACRRLGDLSGLQRSLGNQAVGLMRQGRVDEAVALHEQQGRLSRRLGDPIALQACLGNWAMALVARGDFDGALALLDEKMRLCRQLGDPARLARTYAQQARLFAGLGQPEYAGRLAVEARRLARGPDAAPVLEEVHALDDWIARRGAQ